MRLTRHTVTFALIGFFIITALCIANQASAAETWTLKGGAKLNPDNERTHFEGGGAMADWFSEERFLGKTEDFTITETSMTFKDREYDRGEYWNVTFTANFAAPPATLTAGETITLPASVSGSGSITEGGGGQSGIQFEYQLNGSTIEDSYLATNLDFISDSAEPSFVVPMPSAGSTLTISAGLWNCAACKVVWEYEPGETTSANVNSNTNTNSAAPVNAVTNTTATTVETTDNPCMEGWLQEDIEKARALPGGVTIIRDIVGTVEVLREGDTEWTPAQEFMILQPGEAIRTGEGASAGIITKKVLFESDDAYIPYEIRKRENLEELARNAYLRDNGTLADSFEILYGWMKAISSYEQDWSKYRPQLSLVDENTTICTGEFYDPDEKGYIELIQGAIHSYIKSHNEGIFSVKAGTTICGIRGSEVYVYYDADTDAVAAYVKDGHMDVTDTTTGETVSLTDMQKVVYQDGELGAVQTMSSGQWDYLAVDADSAATYSDVVAADAAAVSSNDTTVATEESGLDIETIIAFIVFVGIAGFIVYRVQKKKKRSN